MLVILVAFGTILVVAYRKYSSRIRYWSDRGVPGPQPELGYGNLREIWSYEQPRALVLKEWTKKYGQVYGFFDGYRPILVVLDVALINEIFVKRFDCFNATAKFGLQGAQGDNAHMAQASGAQWKRLRTLSTDAFSAKAVRNVFPMIKQSAKQMVQFLEHKEGAEIDAQRPLSYWVFTLASVCPPIIPLLRLFFLVAMMFYSELPILTISKHTRKTIEERKRTRDAGEPTKGDIIDLFLDAEGDPAELNGKAKKLSLNEIVANCKLFLQAGFDTTSVTLSKAIHFLAIHPELQQKLKEEIDDFIADENYNLEEIGNLRYAEAVIKETLRHHPVASGFTTRECSTACDIGGFSFMKGETIFVDSFSLQMDKGVWGEDAEEFRPERWLEESSIDRAGFLAFGAGPRTCLGMRLALVEAKVALVELMRRFTIEKTENTNPLTMVGSFLVSFEQVPVVMKRREYVQNN